MIELNLLPDVKQEFIKTQRQKGLVISLMILTSIVAGGVVVLLGFFAYVAQPGVQLLISNDIKDKATTLRENKELPRDLTIQNQLAVITQLHEDKGVYERLFSYLKTLNPKTPNNVSIARATLDAAGETITLEATAKNYQAVAIFQDTLKNASLSFVEDSQTNKKITTPLFTDIIISEATLGQDSDGVRNTSFKASLTYDPNTFAWSVISPEVAVPNQSTTPSADRVSLFSPSPIKKKEESQ